MPPALQHDPRLIRPGASRTDGRTGSTAVDAYCWSRTERLGARLVMGSYAVSQERGKT